MAPVPQEFVTVDMRGLKGALVERAKTERVAVSALVRAFVEVGLGQSGGRAGGQVGPPGTRMRLCVRLGAAEAHAFTKGARAAGVSQGAFLAKLIEGAPALVPESAHREQLAELKATTAEISTLGRNVRHLSELLQQGSVQAAAEYAGMLERLGTEVRRHLQTAATGLKEVQIQRPSRRGT